MITTFSFTVSKTSVEVKIHKSKDKSVLAKRKKAIFDMTCQHIVSALSYILEKEMKSAYKELWLDIVLKKPPWTLTGFRL